MNRSALPSAGVLIVGAGHAGGSAAAFLRQFGHAGPITLVGAEPIPPYQRPPLSKAWLKGEADAEALMLRPAEWYAENSVDLRLGRTVTAIDRAARTARLDDGTELAWERLILATGARARRLPIPGAEGPQVLELRTASDAERLKAALGPGRRLAVIGGGYVGLEAAASARALGAEAVVIEREPRVLARVACEPLSRFFEDYHRRRGVTFELAAQVAAIQPGRVRLDDGRDIACDAVLVGVGAQPNVELAESAGLACRDGVVADHEARTSDPDIFAIGDVTWRPLPLYDREARLESVPNALEQARQAAAAIAGRPAPAPEVPWFWSDQYDLKLQIAGVPFECGQLISRGDPATARFALFHLKDGVIRAVEAVNAPAEFMAGKQLIARRTVVSPERLADPTVSMKEVSL